MGLTIHHSLTSRTAEVTEARRLVTALRQRALDLPFQDVGDVIELSGAACDFHATERDDSNRWLLIQANQLVERDDYMYDVAPTHLIAFKTSPGEGSEPANFGLCRYPATVEGNDGRSVRTGLADGWF